jgi:Tripartite tricarboxylate transporter TctB family
MEAVRALARTDVRLKIVFAVFFGLFYLLAIPYPEKSRQFPQLIALFSFIVTSISLVRDFARGARAGEIAQVDDTELTGVDEGKGKEKKKRFWSAWGIILAALGAGLLGGFLFATLFLFAGFGLVFGRREDLVKNLIVAVAMTICVFCAFHWLMGVPLLSGLLW